LFLHSSPTPWLILKRQVLKPILNPALRAYTRYRLPQNAPWQSYSAINLEMASALQLKDRMQTAGYDPTFTNSPLKDFRPNIIWADHGIGASISAENAAWHSLSNIDPTSNLSLMEFLLRVPDDQFRRGDNGSWLFRRTFRNRMPEQVLVNQRKGFQSADVGHRILRELPAFRECLNALDSLPEAREMLDMPLLHRCLEDLVVNVDPLTTINAISILLRGLGVGLFLRRLAGSD
jgi:asparagine synthase (glutamine-hydrolysing)